MNESRPCDGSLRSRSVNFGFKLRLIFPFLVFVWKFIIALVWRLLEEQRKGVLFFSLFGSCIDE